MSTFLLLLPLLVIIILLATRQHMLVAGIAGGLVAVIVGPIALGDITGLFLDGIQRMLGITVPVLYAAAAAMIARAGGIKAIVTLAQRSLGAKISILAGIMVLIQALATYTAGLGASNTMITAPLIAAAVGAVPHVIAGLAIATAASFTTSPASTETAVTADWANIDLLQHVTNMQPFWLLFVAIGIGIAVWGVARHGALAPETPSQDGGGEGESELEEDIEKFDSPRLWARAVPAVALLIMVVAGGRLNALFGIPLFTPATIVVFSAALAYLFSPMSLEQTGEALIDGARFILLTLFKVGIFLGFINMLGEIGTFSTIAGMAAVAPGAIVVPVAALAGFLTAIPAGAFAAGVLTLVLPTLSELGLSSTAMGLVAIAVGLGTQISPVQINVAALAYGFNKEVFEIIRMNLKFVLGTFALLLVLSLFVS